MKHINTNNLNSICKFLMVFTIVCFTQSVRAQTTLIDPNGAGGFELGNTFALNGWTLVNGATNQLFVGTVAVPSAGTNSAYVSDNVAGTTYNYINTAASTVHFYRDVTFPAGETNIVLNFKWKCQGEGSYDYVTVYSMPTSVTPVVNMPAGAFQSWLNIPVVYPGAVIHSTPPNLNLQGTYQTQTICLPSSYAGTTRRLVFMWSNDGSAGTQPPGSIDEISLVTGSAPTAPTTQPTSLILTPTSISQINGSFTAASGNPDAYLVVRYPFGSSITNPSNGVSYTAGQTLGLGTVVQASAMTSFSATGLTPSTNYTFYVYSYNLAPCVSGPLYNISSPLSGSASTFACASLAAGTYTVGPTGTYSSLTAVNTALANGTAGPVIFELQSTYNSSVESFPITFTGTPCPINGGVIIRPQAGATNLSITSANATGTILFDGGDNIAFDGRAGGVGISQLTIENTTTTGYAIQFINNAVSDRFVYCTIKGVNTSTSGGVIVFSTSTGLTNGNSNIKFDNCDIRDGATNPTNLFYCSGSTTTYPIGNNNDTISNCNLHDWFNATSTTAGAAINIIGGASDWVITNNSFYQSVSRTFTMTTATDQGAIFVASTNFGVNFTINNNFFGGSAPLCAGAPWTYTGGATGTPTIRMIRFSTAIGLPFSSISNNTIANIDITSSSTSTAHGLITHLNGNVNINNNLIGSMSALNNIKFTLASTSTAPFFLPISLGTGASLSKIRVQNNSLGGITVATNSTGSVSFRVLYAQPPALSTLNISNNTVGGTVANSIQQLTNGIMPGIMVLNPTVGDTISNNIIQNLTHNNTGVTGSVTGINIQASGGKHLITGNTIFNLTSNSTNVAINNAASVVGLTMTGSIVGGTEVSGNTIYNLTNTNNTVAGWINGMYFGTGLIPQPNTVIAKNFVHSINLASPTGGMAGIFLPNAGNALCYNNMVRLGIDASGNSITNSLQINGIYKNSSGAMGIYHNTVYIGGTGVASGAVNTYAYRRGTAGVTDTVMNNIFYNARSNSSGTGKHYSCFLSVNTTEFEDNNDLFANGTGGVLGLFGVTDYATLPLWRTATNADWNSVSGDPMLINPTGTSSTVDLHIQAGVATQVEGSGYLIAVPGNDFDMQTRSTLTPIDLGADAGNFLLSDVAPPTIYYTPLLPTSCNTGNMSLNGVQVLDATGIPLVGGNVPRIYYRKGAGSWFSQAGTFVSGVATNSFWNFTIVAADMGGLLAGDIVSYYVIAQDNVGTPNVGSYAAGVVASSVNSVTTAPVTPFSYTIGSISLSGTYTVGAAGVYPTLTAAIAAYNSACLNGPVVFNLIDANYSASETFPITINANPFASSTNTLTIKTTQANTVITGLSATALIVLNAADWVTIDGSISNTVNTVCPLVRATRDLTMVNTSTSTASAVIWLQSIASPINGATNNTIKNINITGNLNTQTLFGIGSGSSTISTTSLGIGNNSNSFINNNISKTQYGLYSQGAALAAKNTNNIFNLNLINTASPNNTRLGGIQIGFEDNATVSGNLIDGITNTSSPDIFGITLGYTAVSTTAFIGNEVTNSTVSYNQIGSVTNTGTFSAIGLGIANALSGTNLVFNNMISGVFSNGTAGDYGAGIFAGGGNGSTTKIYNNTVAMSGSGTGGSGPTYALAVGGVQPSMDVRNNILSATGNNGTGINIAFGLAYVGATGNYLNLVSDFNDLFVSGTGSGVGVTGSLAATGTVPTGILRQSIFDWRTETGRDLSSKNVLPEYTSASNLHLVIGGANNNSMIAGMGTSIVDVTNDIDCEVRPGSPAIGADQFPCTYTPNALTFVENSGITPNDGIICSGATASVVASGGVSYLWSTGATTASINVTPAMTTSYTVTVTNAGACTGTATATVTVKSNPTPSITPNPASVCPGKSITLTATGGGTYLWSTGANTAAITVSPGSNTTYTVTVTNADGCTATASQLVTINAVPSAGITPSSQNLCFGKATTLTGTGGGTYFWSTGENTTSIVVAPLVNTTYTVTVTNASGCTATATSTVSIINAATLSSTKVEPTTCTSTDGSINLTVTGGVPVVTFSWTGPGGFTAITEDISGLKIGSYSVTVTSGNGCTSTASVFLNGPGTCNTGSITISDPCKCKNNATTLQNGQFSEQVKVTAASGQTWTVVANTGLFLTTSPPPPAAPIIIPNGTVLLESPAGSGMYLLNGIHVDSIGYNITVTNGISTLNIGDVCYYPNPTFMSLDTAYCKSAPPVTLMTKGFLGNGTNLPVTGSSTYMVDGITATQLIPANLSVGGHTVMGNFDADSVNVMNPGCIQKMTQNVQINALGVATPTRDTNTCAGRIHPGYVFTGTPAGMVSFTWRKTSAAGGAATTIAANGSGNIPVFTATNPGCGILTDTIFVTPSNTRGNCIGVVDTFLIRTAPTPTVNQIRDSSFCNGQMWTPPAFAGNCTAQTIYRWVKKIGPGGGNIPGLPLSGVGNLPKLTIVNPPPGCLILTDTIITTPIYLIPGTTDSCVGTPMKFVVKSVPMPVIVALPDVTYCANSALPGFTLSSNCTVTTQRWKKTTVGGPGNSGTTIPTTGTGNIPPFTTINPGFVPRIDTIISLSVFISVGDSCVGIPDTFLITVLPVPTVFAVRDTSYCSGVKVPQFNFAGGYTGPGIKFNWTRTGVNIGVLPLSGVDNVPMFMAMNLTAVTVTETFTVTPVIMLNGANCSGTPLTFKISVLPAAVAICKNATVYLDANGNYIMDPNLISNGSRGGTLTTVPSSFTCRNIGANSVTLVVTDPCGISSSCVATVTVLDTIKPTISCKDVTINLQPGECQGRLYYVPTATDNCSVAMVIAEDTAKYGSGKFIDKGVHTVCYMAMDQSGNTSRCCSKITVLGYQGATKALACNDNIQVSLDQNCRATITPDMVLEGGPYKCYDEYVVRIQLWTGGAFIDRDPNLPGVQLDSRDIGKEFKITIVDTATGNSCWAKATVEDKLAPQITCIASVSISCAIEPTPANTGTPVVVENCGGYSLSYTDSKTQGGCSSGFQDRIIRTWVAIDASGNRSTCVQTITVRLGDMFDVEVPRNYDELDLPALRCNEKIDRNKDVTQHMADYPECVDGYILDSVFWRANPTQPNIYPNRRLPRVLGWNCLDDTSNLATFGHPNPDPVYYPQHRQWSPQNPLCWGPDRHIMWIGTGKPTGANICRNLNMVYEDIVLNNATKGCDAGPIGCYKILRKWTVLDWCTSVVGGHNQIIKVADLEGPDVLYPDSARINMESFNCTGRWEVPAPWITDNCSNEVHYSVEAEYGTITGNEKDGFVIINMPEGIYNGYIVATDCCGNITKKRVVLNVIDRVPPQAICRTYTTVSIIGNQSPNENIAKICAKDLDEGSFDNCQNHVWFKMIRMSELLGTNNGSNANNVNACNGANGDDNAILAGNQIYFDDCSYFCCADVGTRVMVVLRVFDVDPGSGPVAPNRMSSTTSVLNGRFADCMVEVEVQNKAVPTVIPPPNIVVSCSFWFDINTLTNPNDATFGKVVTDLTLRRKVVTQDIVCAKFCKRNVYTGYPGYVATNVVPKPAPNQACDYYNVYFDTAHWDRKYELVWGFDGYVINSCGNPVPTITVNDLRECGQGQIQRVISTIGPNNLNVSAIQTIWVVDCDPFYIDNNTCNDPRFTDLMWPNGVCTATPITLDGCGADTSPDNPQLGRPQIINNADDNCSLISIEYRDEKFTIEPDACYKILRTWTVIDWCQYDPFINETNGRWTALQIIKVRDKDKPVVQCEVGDCEPATLNASNKICYGHINLTASATDNCTPEDWLSWEYKIDLYNDGKGIHGAYDTRVGTLTSRQYKQGDTVEYSHNPYADDNHNPFNGSGKYPVGTHKICWFVEDGCGNVGVCCSLFTIRDCKAPTPYCATGVITVPMPSSKCIDIWAKDLDRGSYDNCTPQDKLKFYFDGDPNKTSIRICCDDFVEKKVNDELNIDVEMWVEDEEGNKDYCKTLIIIQDNNLCPNVGSAKGKITGQILTEKNEETSPVDLRLYMNGSMIVQKVGSPYSFGDLDLSANYIVEPERKDDPLNGVTTQDIVALQKHILGKELINSPYKLIAGDVNNSKSISSADIAEIRKLILGTISEFSKVKSWTFVPNKYKFTDPTNPFDAPRVEDIHFTQTAVDELQQSSFMAIKMGDITNSARAKNIGTVKDRSSGNLKIDFDERELVAGEEVIVEYHAQNFNDIEGYQFTLKFDIGMLSYEGIERGVLNVDESNFGVSQINRGILTTSWNSNKGESFNSNDILFKVKYRVLRSGKLSQNMVISSDITKAQAYNAKGDVLDVQLKARNKGEIVETGIFELYQNEPNPFNKVTTINYSLPESGLVKLTIYDMAGKVMRVYRLQGSKGMNSYQLKKEEIGTSGVLYYQLDANHNTATKKMIVIE